MINLLTVYTQKTPKLVKAIYFNKTQDNNWLVGWHQDKTIALQEKIPTPGYINWTKKQGVIHVQPPLEIMENILTLRIHLDRTDLNNGALKVIPKTHKMGFLNSERIKQLTTTNKTVVCEADAGDILIMSPLIVHSSAKSINNCDRRIIHLEYTLISLPQHLHWAES
jgi:ectoine hydroxylase-related dioxygenase (phytanoyl-CoA dioxygenase family)